MIWATFFWDLSKFTRNNYRETLPNCNLSSLPPPNSPLLLGTPTFTGAQKLLLHNQSSSECGPKTNEQAQLATTCSYLMMAFLFFSWMPFLSKLSPIYWWGNMDSIRYSFICKVGELEILFFSQMSNSLILISVKALSPVNKLVPTFTLPLPPTFLLF